MTAETYHLRRLYWWSFALRFSLGIVGWLLMRFTAIPFLQDALYYEELGAGVAHDWLNGRSSTWLEAVGPQQNQPVLLVAVIGCFYVLTFGVRALPLLLVFCSALGAFTPVLIFRIARQIGASPSAALRSGWLVAITPAFIFWSGSLYKEGLLLLILSLAIHHALRLQANWRTQSFLILSLCFAGLAALRLYLALIMAVAMGLCLLFGRAKKHMSRAELPVVIRQAMVAMLFVIIMTAVYFASRAREVMPADFEALLGQIQTSRDDLSHTQSGYLPDANVSTTQDAARFMPLGLAYFLTVPLPWQTGSIRQNMAIPDTAVWLLLYPVILIGMAQALRRNFQGSILLIVASVGLCLFYALLVANVGSAYRLRIQIWLLWAPFLGLGWEALSRLRANSYTISYQKA